MSKKLLAAAAALCALAAFAQPSSGLRETVVEAPVVDARGHRAIIDVTIFRPGPALARRMHAAFVRSGGNAEFSAAPATGSDGHARARVP